MEAGIALLPFLVQIITGVNGDSTHDPVNERNSDLSPMRCRSDHAPQIKVPHTVKRMSNQLHSTIAW